jgi:hypothetical protein
VPWDTRDTDVQKAAEEKTEKEGCGFIEKKRVHLRSIRRAGGLKIAEIFQASSGLCRFLSGLCSDHYQSETGDQRDRAEDRRDRKSVLSLVGDLYGTDIDVLFFMREGDSTGRIADDAKDDEEYSNDGGWLHEMKTFPERRAT